MRGTVTAVVGGQYGSEAKGVIVNHMAWRYGVHVRTGGPNAGHTIYHKGEKWVMRSIPCGWVNPEALLIIGPGALLDLELLTKEVEALELANYRVRDRLFVDSRAMVIDPVRHHRFEGGVEGMAHKLIGSTGEGVGPARMARVARRTFDVDSAWAKINSVGDLAEQVELQIMDTVDLVNEQIDNGIHVLLEGTQGSGLSLIHGCWPYVTSSDTNAGQLAVDAGISPSYVDKTILVCRTHPIRVAGNSGPLYGETTWEELGQERETTTVTKKVRRVGWWDDLLVQRAVTLNRPCEIALTFANYLDPGCYDARAWSHLSPGVQEWIIEAGERVGAEVTMVGTSPWTVIDR